MRNSAFISLILCGCLGFPYQPEHVVESDKCVQRARPPVFINLPPAERPTYTIPEEETIPYPDAVAPDPYPAVAPSEDSDCGGMIDIGLPVRVGTWTIGDSYHGGLVHTYVFFNTKEDAFDCIGSSDFKAWKATRRGWVGFTK